MATLPPSSDITSSTATEGNAKTWLAAVRTFIAQQLGAAGTQAESLSTLGAPFNGSSVKTGAYTVVAADRGKVINCSGTFTLSVTAAATLGDGFMFAVWNSGGGTITVDPNLSETVDGATTKAVSAGKLVVFFCSGSNFCSVGGSVDGVTSLNGQTGAITNTDLYAIGSYVVGRPANMTNYTVNSTLAGSSLYSNAVNGNVYLYGAWQDAGAPTLVNVGTWRCVSPARGDGSSEGLNGLWVRIS